MTASVVKQAPNTQKVQAQQLDVQVQLTQPPQKISYFASRLIFFFFFFFFNRFSPFNCYVLFCSLTKEITQKITDCVLCPNK